MTSQTGNKGFTLTELLVVTAIIIVIVSTVVVISPGLKESAKKERTKTLLARIEVAIDNYYSDYREYPDPSGQDTLLTLLMPTGANSKQYVEVKDVEKGGNEDKYFVDEWGNEIVYDETPTYNTSSYDLYSKGPDGVTLTSGNDEDDINNWSQ